MAKLDITEIDGFDNLHSPCGILKDSMQKAAKIFKSENSIYLVNGSTCGILASILALANDGDKVILDRYSHKSVYNAIELSGAEPVYIKPSSHEKYGIGIGITPEQVALALSENPDAKLIIITSPSYEGVISDIEGIVKVAKSYNVPVMVDSAHGAHLGFDRFPKSAVSAGADIVIASLHKTLPSLTQTAICHVKDKYLGAVSDMLSAIETSSPSYILLSSMDECMDIISKKNLFSDWYNILLQFRKDTKSLKNLQILRKDNGFFDLDISKIVIMTSDAGRLFKRLKDHGIEPEMMSLGYVLCMTGPGDTKKSLNKLKKVLFKIDAEFEAFEKKVLYPPIPERSYSPKSVKKMPDSYLSLKDAQGRISKEYIWAYPPGIPLIVPGEVITREIIGTLEDYKKNGVSLFGKATYTEGKILVIST